MIIYGRKANHIGSFKVNGTQCAHCHQVSTQRVSVFGLYAHIFWIPCFPMGKKAVAECMHCLRTIERRDFTPELESVYTENKSLAKRPYWHWLGLGVFVTLVALIAITSETADEDPRRALLQADLEQLTATPSATEDSLSSTLKTFFTDFANPAINPEEFEFMSRTEGDRLLVLAKIPDLKRVERDGREEVLEMIEMVIGIFDSLEGKEQYIGVHGRFNMMMIKTPTAQENGRIIVEDPIYDFYGARPPATQ